MNPDVCWIVKSTSSSYSVYFDTKHSPKKISSTWNSVNAVTDFGSLLMICVLGPTLMICGSSSIRLATFLGHPVGVVSQPQWMQKSRFDLHTMAVMWNVQVLRMDNCCLRLSKPVETLAKMKPLLKNMTGLTTLRSLTPDFHIQWCHNWLLSVNNMVCLACESEETGVAKVRIGRTKNNFCVLWMLEIWSMQMTNAVVPV